MAGSTSPYYPPRARWYSPLRFPWFRARHSISKLWSFCDRTIIIGWRATILSLVIPGFVFRAFGYRIIGTIAMSGCCAALLIFFVWLGYPAATIAFALILSLHVTSVAFLLSRIAPGQSLLLKLASTLGVLFVLNILVYGSLQRKLEQTFMPLRIGKNIVVMKGGPTENIQRGDWIAYRVGDSLGRFNNGSFIVRDGFGMDQVLARSGDVIRFGKTSFQVNDRVFTRKPYMPISGELKISEKQWFVWPGFAIQNNGIPEATITMLMQSYAVVAEKELIGKPYERWFWRKQILP